MDAGLMIRFGGVVPGRETQAVAMFEEASRYYASKVAQGTLTYFEPFFLTTGDLDEEGGFFILKGPAPEVFKLMEEEPYQWLLQKASLVVEHVRTDLLTVGDSITEGIERFAKVRAELGI